MIDRRRKIFLSYNADRAALVRQVAADLERAGFEIWMDIADIPHSAPWRAKIMEGLRTCHWVLLFLSQGSTKPTCVCHDEIAMVLHTRGPILTPILVDDLAPATLREDMTELQWLKPADWQSFVDLPAASPAYRSLLDSIVSVLNGEQAATLADKLDLLRAWLRPMEQATEVSNLVEGFVGREWLRDIVDQRGRAPDKPKLIWLVGGPGTGKSAFAAWLALHAHANVVGINLCRFFNADRNVPANVLRTLAFRLALRISEYGDAILHKFAVHRAGRDIRAQEWPLSDAQLFQDLFTIVPPDTRGRWRQKRFLLAIDGLEETLRDGHSPLADLLASSAETLPSWLCLVVACRPNTPVDRTLGQYLPGRLCLDVPAEHDSDLRAFAMGWLRPGRSDAEADAQIAKVLAAAHGAFLYLRALRDAVENGTMCLDDPRGLPLGLSGLYERWFAYDFPKPEDYETFVPLIEIAAAARQPVPFHWVCRLLGWTDRRQANRRFDRLTSLLKAGPATIAPFHESLRDWLTGSLPTNADGSAAHAGHGFVVESDAGRRVLAAGLWAGLQQDLDAAPNARPDLFVLTELPAHLDSLPSGTLTAVSVYAALSRIDAKLKYETDPLPLSDRRALVELAWHLADRIDSDPARAWAMTGRGEIAVSSGALQAALSNFLASLAIAERLAAADPGNADWQRDLSVSHNRIGDVQSAQGDLGAALSSFLASLAIRERLAAADPGNAGWQRDLSVSHERIGDVQSAQGDLGAALSRFRASLAIAERLAVADPGNAGWQRDLATGHERLGVIHMRQDNQIEAKQSFVRALEIYTGLTARNPSDIASLVSSVVPRLGLARLDPAHARMHLTQALAILKPLAAANRLDVKRQSWIPDIEARLAALGG